MHYSDFLMFLWDIMVCSGNCDFDVSASYVTFCAVQTVMCGCGTQIWEISRDIIFGALS